jgi:hypothetical protein
MGGAPEVKVPGPSKEERLLQQRQADLLQQQSEIIGKQMQQQEALLPFMAEQMGIDLQRDSKGNVIGATKRADPLEAKRTDIEKQLLQRTQDALGGKLPVDPALESSLGTQEQQLRSKLQQQFGAGYETSTPGIQALEEFRKSAEGLRYGARTGQLTLSEQLGLSNQEMQLNQQQQQLGIFRQAAIGDPLSFMSASGSTAQGYGQAQVPFIQQRQMQLNASIANAQNSMQMMGGIGSMFGTLFGGLMGMSDERVKEELEVIGWLEWLGIPIYLFKFIGVDGKRVGVLAQDVQEVYPAAVAPLDGLLHVNYHMLEAG